MNSVGTITTDGQGSSVVRRRKGKELSMRFRIRPAYVGQERHVSLYIRLSVNGQVTSDYSSGIKVPANKWDQTLQRVSGRSSLILEINERLGEVELQHREILRELKRLHSKGQGPRPTAALVKQEFVSPGSVSPTLAVWYMKYLDYLDTLAGTEDERAEKTLARAYKTRDYIREFSGNSKVLGSPDKSPYLYDLTTGWGKRFHAWLQIDPVTGRQRMQKDSANKHLSHVRDAISYAVDEGNLSSNPLDKFRPKRGKGKEVYFLEPDHIDRLMGLTLDGGMGDVVWWAKLMCLTGLDYVDAVRYARNRADYEKTNDTGKRKICIDRSKPPRNYCEIWLLPEVEQLFKQCPIGPDAPVLADINRNLKVMQVAIGFKPVLTSKICRKTAGAHFLRMGFQLSTVSKMLGHSSIRTTEDHYVKVMPSHVDQDIERVSRYSEVRPINPIIEREPFRRIA